MAAEVNMNLSKTAIHKPNLMKYAAFDKFLLNKLYDQLYDRQKSSTA